MFPLQVPLEGQGWQQIPTFQAPAKEREEPPGKEKARDAKAHCGCGFDHLRLKGVGECWARWRNNEEHA